MLLGGVQATSDTCGLTDIHTRRRVWAESKASLLPFGRMCALILKCTEHIVCIPIYAVHEGV